MRNIKFRVWDKYENKFLPYPCFFNHLDFNEFTCFDRWFKCNEEKITVQEFTGIKDKDGKEIFEGDIAQFSYEEKGTIFKGRVEYFSDRASFGIVTGNAFTTFDEHLDYMHLLKVIGNIFENPELSKETQV